MDDKKSSKSSTNSADKNKINLTSKTKPEPEDEDFYLNNDEDDHQDEDDDDFDDFDDYMDDTDDIGYSDSSSKFDQTPSVEIQNQNNKPTTANPHTQSDTSTSLKNTPSHSAHQASDLSKSVSKRSQMDLDEEFKYEVLTPDKIVQYMIECIKDVNQVLELTPTTTRILLNHFRWDKEKLMERFYDGDQDRLFREAHVVNPFKLLNQRKVIFFKILSNSFKSSKCKLIFK